MRVATLSLMLAVSAINISTAFAQSGSFVINYQAPSEPEQQLSVLSFMAGAVEPEDPSYNPQVTDYTDWSCKPSKAHPYPVIMLHGLLAPSFTRFVTSISEQPCVFCLTEDGHSNPVNPPPPCPRLWIFNFSWAYLAQKLSENGYCVFQVKTTRAANCPQLLASKKINVC